MSALRKYPWPEDGQYHGPAYRHNVYNSYVCGDNRPVSLGGGIKSPEWLKDSVLPYCMPNGLSYSEMRSLIGLHRSEAWEITASIAGKGTLEGDEGNVIALFKNATEQETILAWFRQFLMELDRNFTKASSLEDSEYRKQAWLVEKTVHNDQFFAMDCVQVKKALDDYFSRFDTAADVCCGENGLMDGAIIMYQAWMEGEELLDVFDGMLEGTIKRCREIIKNGGKPE